MASRKLALQNLGCWRYKTSLYNLVKPSLYHANYNKQDIFEDEEAGGLAAQSKID